MGTHINCPSKVRTAKGTNLSLKDWITQHPEQLGEAITKRFGGDLPFLFKVLSVNKALSVQAHPNKVCCVLKIPYIRSSVDMYTEHTFPSLSE